MTPRINSLPNLTELRAMNSQNGSGTDSASEIPRCLDNGDLNSIVGPLTEFFSSIFAIQADLTGVSSAVAEYLAWVRTSPGRAENIIVLEILEARVRELNQIASTKHWAALKSLIASMDKSSCWCSLLRKTETDLKDKNTKTGQFFHEGYHIDSTLAEQRYD